MKRRDDRIVEEMRRLAKVSVKPPCFSLVDWKLWRDSARIARPSELDSYCADCCPDYKEKMLKADRCIWPDVEFRIDGDGFVEGFRPSTRYIDPKKNAQKKDDTQPSAGFGESHPKAKLSDGDVDLIRGLVHSGKSYRAVGGMFGISVGHVFNLVKFYQRTDQNGVRCLTNQEG